MDKVFKIISLATGIMKAVEVIIGKGKGDVKKEAYLEGIMGALSVGEVALDKDLIDNEKFRVLMGKLADDTIAINNFIRDWKSKSEKTGR